jgi:hypothetical protein
MYLLWLRVAVILYAAASVAVFPAVLYGRVGWRKSCVHLGGMAFFFHFISCVEMLCPGRGVFSGLVDLRRDLAGNLRLTDYVFRGFCAVAGR